jgi:hypothetical protein
VQLLIEKNANFPVANVSHEAFDAMVHAGGIQQFDDIISANDPDLTAFYQAGGKMLTYHGMASLPQHISKV